MTPDLVILGNLLVDDMVFPDGRTRMSEPGGATLYAALGASLWSLAAGVATVRGDDYPVERDPPERHTRSPRDSVEAPRARRGPPRQLLDGLAPPA